jgi:hypothetical protein
MGKTQEAHINRNVKKRKWIGRTLRKPSSDIMKAALVWNQQGTRKRGRPRTRWRRTVLNDLKPEKKSSADVKALAAKRTRS